MTTPPLISVRLLRLFGFCKGESFKPSTLLSGNKYTSRSSLGSAIYQCLHQIPKEDYLSAFRDWVERLQNCVSVKGEYFDGL